MADNYNDFLKEMESEVDVMEDRVSNIFKQTALDFLEYEISPPPRGTPVDTGFTRNSWNITVNAPSSNTIGVPGTLTGASTAKDKQDQSIRVLKMIPLEEISDIYINNGNDWIEDLDKGSSTQHPGGFVALGEQYAEENLKINGRKV